MAKSVLKSKCLSVQIHEERSAFSDKLGHPWDNHSWDNPISGGILFK